MKPWLLAWPLIFLLLLASLSSAAQQSPLSETQAQQSFLHRLVASAIERTHHSVRYVSAYVRIPYPGGDVPADTGVCTDEIIRIYRAVGIDLQKQVHEDMSKNFALYPHRWQSTSAQPDSNIDHRRVPNLMVFFSRKGESLPTTRPADYSPGDLVTWDLGGGVPHIGMVVDTKSSTTGRYLIVHNIGEGPKWKTCCSIGESQGITAISVRRPSSAANRATCSLLHFEYDERPIVGWMRAA